MVGTKQRNFTQQTLDLPGDKESSATETLKVAGLFAGIGGIEVGLHRHDMESVVLCELDDGARKILETHFPYASLIKDVRDVQDIGGADVLTAGFPCQDLSQAGRTAGIKGSQSGLVGEVFRLLEMFDPKWLLLENVPFMLSLDRGAAMTYLTSWLTDAGFNWAYRVVDSRSFGVPQRRHRVVLLASRTEDPRPILFSDDAEPELPEDGDMFGFYWTEGKRGLGWGVEAVPPLKKGSTVGIPSPPAIWVPSEDFIGVPDIRDAERLQGFDSDWTKPAVDSGLRTERGRWSYVGNAVTVDMADWIGSRLRGDNPVYDRDDKEFKRKGRWPNAAWGGDGKVHVAEVSKWPLDKGFTGLSEFLEHPLKPLSERAAKGFLKRARESTLNFKDGFLDSIAKYIDSLS